MPAGGILHRDLEEHVVTRRSGFWLKVFTGVAVLVAAGCAQQKPAPAVDETDPGVAAAALEEDSKRTGVK